VIRFLSSNIAVFVNDMPFSNNACLVADIAFADLNPPGAGPRPFSLWLSLEVYKKILHLRPLKSPQFIFIITSFNQLQLLHFQKPSLSQTFIMQLTTATLLALAVLASCTPFSTIKRDNISGGSNKLLLLEVPIAAKALDAQSSTTH